MTKYKDDDETEPDPKGFATIPRWLQRDTNVSWQAKLVYLAISSRAGSEPSTYVSHRLLAADASCSTKSVQRALSELRELGVLTWEARYRDNGTGQSSNLYTIYTGRVRPRVVPETPRTDSPGVGGLSDLGGRTDSPGGPDSQSYQEGTPIEVEPIEVENLLVIPADAGPTEEELFAEFWKIYPRKKARVTAAVAFRRALRGTPFADIIDGAHRYAAEVEGRDPSKVAHGATWLNQHRWEDEPDQPHLRQDQPQKPTVRESAAAAHEELLRRQAEHDLRALTGTARR